MTVRELRHLLFEQEDQEAVVVVYDSEWGYSDIFELRLVTGPLYALEADDAPLGTKFVEIR